jgi:hypothetical protein
MTSTKPASVPLPGPPNPGSVEPFFEWCAISTDMPRPVIPDGTVDD